MTNTIIDHVTASLPPTLALNIQTQPLDHGNITFKAVVDLNFPDHPLHIFSLSTKNGTWTDRVGWQIYPNSSSNPISERDFVLLVAKHLIDLSDQEVPPLWKKALTDLPLLIN